MTAGPVTCGLDPDRRDRTWCGGSPPYSPRPTLTAFPGRSGPRLRAGLQPALPPRQVHGDLSVRFRSPPAAVGGRRLNSDGSTSACALSTSIAGGLAGSGPGREVCSRCHIVTSAGLSGGRRFYPRAESLHGWHSPGRNGQDLSVAHPGRGRRETIPGGEWESRDEMHNTTGREWTLPSDRPFVFHPPR